MGIIIFTVILIVLVVAVIIVAAKSILSPKKITAVKKAMKEGRYQQAQALAKAIIAKDPKDYEAHYWLGEAYSDDNKSDLAFSEYKIVNENALFGDKIPEVQFRKKLAKLYQKYSQNENALKQWLLLTKLDPKCVQNYMMAGKIYEQENLTANAMLMYQKVLDMDKHNDEAHALYGNLFLKFGQFMEAKKEIDTAIKINPENPKYHYYLGKIFKGTKDYTSAIKSFEKSLVSPELKQRAFIERGSCFLAIENIENAINEFDLAIKCAKSEEEQETLYARYFLASCYESIHNLDKAIEQWNLISKRNKNFKDVPAKLNQYKDIQSNDSIKEYLTASEQNFLALTKDIVKKTYNYVPLKSESIKYGCTIFAEEANKDKGARIPVYMLQFLRSTAPVSDATVRQAVEIVKKGSCVKAIIFSSSGFTTEAKNFADSRPVVLVGKEEIETIMSKIGV